MTPQMALEYGLIDEVVEIMPKDVAESMKGFDE
jgi:ATP-dependent protease ClpP protease subunit